MTLDDKVIDKAEIVTEQFVPMGHAASQIAIKQSETNGGGYMGVNSAHPHGQRLLQQPLLKTH